jgi:hypothetical protein
MAPVLACNVQEEPPLLHDELPWPGLKPILLLTAIKLHFLIYSHTIGKALPSAQASFNLRFFIWPLALSKMVQSENPSTKLSLAIDLMFVPSFREIFEK